MPSGVTNTKLGTIINWRAKTMNQKRKKPFNLETASWIAAVGGLVFAVYSYEYPSKQQEKEPLETT